MQVQRVALAGATGNLGLPILSALLKVGHTVIVLSRQTSTSSSKIPIHPNLKVAHVDFSSTASLIPVLTCTQVVICCLATSALGTQKPLIDAAVAAGVSRFIPAEFGMDSQNELAMRLPVCVPKVETQAYLNANTRADPKFSWTAIACGLFLDWGLEMGFVLNIKARKATLYNGGDVKFSATLLADVAEAVLGVIAHTEETKDRVIYVHSALVTQNQPIQYANDKDGKDWDIMVKETETIKQESYAELEKGERADMESALLGFCIVAMFDEEYGCNFSDKLNNDMAGVSNLNEDEIRRVVENLL
jgi:nucleoside-diphosphate-sugar epimerase